MRTSASVALPPAPESSSICRHDWREEEIQALLSAPFFELLHRAHSVHREYFDPQQMQLSTLINIKSGGCPEDCAYCPQSAHYDTGVNAEKLLDSATVVAAARRAKDAGATRFCMAAAWRSPKDRDLARVADIVSAVRDLDMETCVTLGMLDEDQAHTLKRAGLDYYNHNLDTSPEYYGEIISTRTYEDRLRTLAAVRAADINVCCGGIIGMGETQHDRAALLVSLANFPRHPESVPINMLVRVAGTPLASAESLDSFEFVRTIAAARIVMPRAYVRLSAGRTSMNDEAQALAFYAGANSIFYGERLLTTPNPVSDQDRALFQRLNIQAHQ